MNRSERRLTRRADRGKATQSFASAIRFHRAGALIEAERHYRDALAADPNHVDCLHNLGILAIQTGRPTLAVELIGRAVALNGRLPDAHYNLAAALQASRQLEEAVEHYRKAITVKPSHVEAHMNLGNALTELGRYADAMASYDRVLAIDPRSAAAHYNAANVLAREGKLDAAAARYREAIGINPNLPEPHNNLGNTLRDAGHADEAEAEYRRALALRPEYADAHNNLGIVVAARGATDEAVSHYRSAVRINPDFAEAHNNLGVALFRHGRPEDAIAHLQKALALNGRYIDAYLNLARQLYAIGDVEQALDVAARALDVTATPDTKSLFARYAGALLDVDHAERYRGVIVRALSEGWTRTSDLEHVSILLIKRNTAVARVLARNAEPGRDVLAPEDLAAIADDRLLRCLMTSARVADRELERLMTAARRALLAASVELPGDIPPAGLDFACALAQQCFINEYVFAETADERGAVDRLIENLAGRLQSGGEVSGLWPIVIAAYVPLHAVPELGGLLERDWPAPVIEVLTQQIREPREENEIQTSLPVLTPIGEGVSRMVQEQYEENPYPRWILPAPAVTAYSLGEYLRMKFPLAPMRRLSSPRPPDVLIAGCGTGAHAIETYRKIAGAQVLAIDLSRRSLAYAIRKTRSLGLPIDYAHADIMQLGGIGRTFDVIESSGVLHHLADPMAGWRILLSLLKPGGVMSVGLYSKLARADINAARAFIAERGHRATQDDIRRSRQDFLALPQGSPGQTVTRSGDFYSMSECRDLLFHVQEHQHTLPEIAAFIAEQGLRFLGFDIDSRVLNLYAKTYPQDPAMIDLACWDEFERNNPSLFVAMYQFVVQKP
jgi:tetratricopeptide (TPR) repeat protein/SAM-dependent methyltransferase